MSDDGKAYLVCARLRDMPAGVLVKHPPGTRMGPCVRCGALVVSSKEGREQVAKEGRVAVLICFPCARQDDLSVQEVRPLSPAVFEAAVKLFDGDRRGAADAAEFITGKRPSDG